MDCRPSLQSHAASVHQSSSRRLLLPQQLFVAPALSVMHRSISSSCTSQQRKVNPSLASPDLQAGVMQSSHANGCVNGSASEHQRLAASANGLAACLQAQLHVNGNGHSQIANGNHTGLGSDLGSEAASEFARPLPYNVWPVGVCIAVWTFMPPTVVGHSCPPGLRPIPDDR